MGSSNMQTYTNPFDWKNALQIDPRQQFFEKARITLRRRLKYRLISELGHPIEEYAESERDIIDMDVSDGTEEKTKSKEKNSKHENEKSVSPPINTTNLEKPSKFTPKSSGIAQHNATAQSKTPKVRAVAAKSINPPSKTWGSSGFKDTSKSTSQQSNSNLEVKAASKSTSQQLNTSLEVKAASKSASQQSNSNLEVKAASKSTSQQLNTNIGIKNAPDKLGQTMIGKKSVPSGKSQLPKDVTGTSTPTKPRESDTMTGIKAGPMDISPQPLIPNVAESKATSTRSISTNKESKGSSQHVQEKGNKLTVEATSIETTESKTRDIEREFVDIREFDSPRKTTIPNGSENMIDNDVLPERTENTINDVGDVDLEAPVDPKDDLSDFDYEFDPPPPKRTTSQGDTDDVCKVCKKSDNEDKILLCDHCDGEYHTYCLNPPIREIPEGNWYCSTCTANGIPEVQASTTDSFTPSNGTASSNTSSAANTTMPVNTGNATIGSTTTISNPSDRFGGTLTDSAISTAPSNNAIPVLAQATNGSAQVQNIQSAATENVNGENEETLRIDPRIEAKILNAIRSPPSLEARIGSCDAVVIHACHCEEERCKMFNGLCREVKNVLSLACWVSHNNEWLTYRVSGVLSEYLAFHSIRCANETCRVPFCLQLRYPDRTYEERLITTRGLRSVVTAGSSGANHGSSSETAVTSSLTTSTTPNNADQASAMNVD